MARLHIPLALAAGFLLAPVSVLAGDHSPGQWGGQGVGHRGGFILDLAFSALDADKDGKVSREEYEKNRPNKDTPHKADANKDGTVTLEEAQEAAAKKARDKAATRFKRLDANNDGKFTPDEAKALRDKAFVAIDANKDGTLGKDEIARGHHHRMMMRHRGMKGPWMAPPPPAR